MSPSDNILQELGIKRELLGHVRKRKLSYYEHPCRDRSCQITKTVVEGYVEGRRRRGRSRKQYMDNIKQWTKMTIITGCRPDSVYGLPKTTVAGRKLSAK